jgi:hypothetical protein
MTTINQIPKSPRELEQFYRDIAKMLGNMAGIAWSLVNKAGSRLNEIVTRPHSDLQEIRDWESGTNDRHISVENGVDWQAHVDTVDANPHETRHSQILEIEGTGTRHITLAENAEVTAIDSLAAGMVVKTGNAAYTPRSIQGTANEVAVSFGDGQSGNPTVSLPDRIETPRIFGTESDNTTVEEDGTVKFNGAGRVWKDVFFPMAPPKATGAGNPTLTTWLGNLRGYVFAVNDTHDFDPQEFTHDGKEGSTGQFHIHFVSRTNVAAERAVKFRLEYSQANRNGVFAAPTTVETEIVIPANTPANTHIAEDLASFTTGLIASQMFVKLTRIAAAVTAPADDPIVIGVHYHYELDTVGSRQVFTK